MKKKLKSKLVIWGIILIIFIGAMVYISSKKHSETSEEVAKCIGKNSELYIQIGCSACKTQENMFGKYYKYLDKTDCFFNMDKCVERGIQKTPTWIIKSDIYEGIQNITTLQELTGC